MKKEEIICGSMTIEAALIFPILMILIMNLFSAIEIYRIHSSIAESLWQNGRISTQNMYVTTVAEDVLPELDTEEIYGTVSHFLSLALTRQKIIDELNEEPVWKRIVSLREAGLFVTNEANGDILQMRCSYSVHPLFPLWTLTTKHISNNYYGHAWTGFDLSKAVAGECATEEEHVYITENGMVYHRNRNCSYLNPSIRIVHQAYLADSRNLDGEIFEACTCCKGANQEDYYITDYGINYHASLECHGLKRTIHSVKISQIGGRTPCTKCGG